MRWVMVDDVFIKGVGRLYGYGASRGSKRAGRAGPYHKGP